MKKALLIISIFISGFGFSQTITGIGNITETEYGLVGFPACNGLSGSIFTFSGGGFTSLDLIRIETFSSLLQKIDITVTTMSGGYYQFELPNVTSAGINTDFKLSGQLVHSEMDYLGYALTVLSCPIANNNQPTIELGEVVEFFGNDLDLVSSIDLSVAGENLIYPNVPFQYFGNGIMNVTFPSSLTLLNKFLIPTLNYPGTIGGVAFSAPGIQLVAPIPAPIITTVLGLDQATSQLITIQGFNLAPNSIVNIGGQIVTNILPSPFAPPFSEILFSIPTNARFLNPYITVTDPASKKSDTWYFPPLITYNSNGSLLGENFDDFNTSLDGSNFLKTIPFEYNTTGFGPQLGLLAYDENGIKLFQFGKNISGIPLTLSESFLATVAVSNISEIKTKDITGDGFPEIFALTSNGIEIFGFNELSGFIQINNIPVSSISNFDIGDVNNDGFNDLVTMNQNSTIGEFGDVYLGSKNGIQSVQQITLLAGVGNETITNYDIIISDVDNNGTNEINVLFKSSSSGKIAIISFSGVVFTTTSTIGVTSNNYNYIDLKTIDLDNDGLLDFAAVAEQTSGLRAKFVQVLQNPIGVFTNSGLDLDLPLETIDDIAYFYGDGDDKIDFVISGEDPITQTNKTFLFQNSTNGALQLRTFTGVELTTSGESLTSFATADLNGDGSVDIVGTNSISGITIFKNNYPCGGSISQRFSSQIPVVTIGGDNLFTLKYSGSKPNAINWTVSVPGIVGFSSLTTSLGSAMVSFTNTFEKTINDQLAAGLNYYNTVSITNIPLSLSGAILNAQISNFCNFTSTSSITISVLDQTACPTVSAANFSFSGDQFPLSIGLGIAFFDVIEPNPYSIRTNYAFYVQKNNSISPIIIDKDAKLEQNRSLNFSRLRLSASIFSTLDGANLFAVASYCGGNFTVFGLNTITVNSCLTDININPKNSSKPFCEFNAEEFESSDGAAIPTNWQISTSIAGVFTNFNTVTGLYSGTNKSILGITTLLSSLNGKSIRFTYNGNCLSEPYLLEIDTKPRFLSPLTNPEPVCGSRGLIEIVAEVPSNLRNPSYQWYKFNSSTAGVFLPIASFTAPYGSVNGLLSITNPDISLDQTQYQLQLSANCGSQNIVATSQPAMIRVLDGPPTGLSVIQNTVVCDGADVSKFFITALGADMQYVWEENNAGTWQVIAEDNVYKPQFDTLFVIDANRTNFTNRTYRVSISSACFTGTGASVTSNQDATFSFYDRPVITSTISGNCILGSSMLSVSPNTSYKNYTWILANGKNTIISKSLEPNYSLILPNTYNVYVNNNKRCTAVQSFPFTYPALVRATITKESTIKENALVANEAASYQWYAYGRHITGARDRKFIGNYNGKYTVKVKYANSCEDVSDTSFVNVAGYLDILRSEAIITDTSITFINRRNIEDDFTKIAIAPNPTNDVFKASFMAKRLTPKLISLLDVNGAVRLETEADYKGLQQYAVEIDVKGLQPGIYFLRLIDEDQTRWAKVVVF
ncbi:MAG: T9SS C-terminal target domain-containing protein [Bacteroidetes bacterium]|nr:MAG: T9SS C-terminal target domain-containing protein [Bacteroidota bacterium]